MTNTATDFIQTVFLYSASWILWLYKTVAQFTSYFQFGDL